MKTVGLIQQYLGRNIKDSTYTTFNITCRALTVKLFRNHALVREIPTGEKFVVFLFDA